MICRPTDAYRDMAPVSFKSDMLSGADAINKAIQSRLGMLYGEWWEDETLGFQVPAFLMEGIRDRQVDMLVDYIVSYIVETKGVTSINSQDYSLEGHDLSVDVSVNTTEGGTVEGSVMMDELLAAVSG